MHGVLPGLLAEGRSAVRDSGSHGGGCDKNYLGGFNIIVFIGSGVNFFGQPRIIGDGISELSHDVLDVGGVFVS